MAAVPTANRSAKCCQCRSGAPLPLTPYCTPDAATRAQQLGARHAAAAVLQERARHPAYIPLTWRPADMDAEVPVFVPAPAPASPPPVSMFPSVPKGPVGR